MNGPSNAVSRDTTEPLDHRLGLLSHGAVLCLKKKIKSYPIPQHTADSIGPEERHCAKISGRSITSNSAYISI